jgi:hypothetical protein
MIKLICSNCETKISEIKKEESSFVARVCYEIVVKVNEIKGETLSEETFLLCPTCFEKTGIDPK